MFIPYASDLKRKKWMREGLLQSASKSFWTPYTGMNAGSIVVQANNTNAAEGHTVVFDYDGNLSGKAIKGKDTAYGKGEGKKKFSDKLTVDRYRLVADNGDAFDGVDIGDLSLTQHSDSRSKLGDLFVRFKDQAIFDTAQGIKDSAPTHIVDLGSTFGMPELLELETALKTGSGFDTGSSRRPLQPFILQDGRPVWLFILDPFMSAVLKASSSYQSLVYNADVRGNDNRALRGVFGKIGNLLLVEADTFFGSTDTDDATFDINHTEVEIAGLRRKDSAGAWLGQPSFDPTLALTSRGLLLGANAVQLGFGKMPDYKLQESTDFAIKSESALETWMNVQKTKLLAETEDYKAAKVAAIDYGCIAVDLVTKAAG